MVTSSVRPSEIQIVSIRDNVKDNRTKIKYTFNFNITETQVEEEVMAEDGSTTTETRTVYQYYQYTSEMEIDLVMKQFIPDILTSLYTQLEPVISQRLQDASVEIPTEISVDS